MASSLLVAARRYLADGWAVIPQRADRKPLIRWKEFQTRWPTPAEIETWWETWPEANIAGVTGRISGRVVADLDPRNITEADWLERFLAVLPATPTVNTPSGGVHLHFVAPADPIPSVTHLRPGLDLKAEGGLVTLPPSARPDGTYSWRGGYSTQPMPAEVPIAVRRYLDTYEAERARHYRPSPLSPGSDLRGQASRLTIDRVLPRLQHLKRSKGGWIARCPGPAHKHGDRRPSLSITVGSGGRVLLHCFAGCPFHAILKALGL